MRPFAAVLTALVLAAAVAWNARSERLSHAEPPEHDPVHWVKLTFGLDGEAVSWDGRVAAVDAEILDSAPWSFEQRDRYLPASHRWFCTTVVLEGRSASSFAEPQRGVLLRVRRGADAALKVTTRQGDFTVKLAELRAGRPATYLDGRASAELLGDSRPLPDRVVDSDAATEDDYPALAIDSRGHRWLAWIGYDDGAKRDHLRVVDLDDPAAEAHEVPTAREQAGPQLAIDGDGVPWLFWSAPQPGSSGGASNWDLWGTRRGRTGWSAPQRLTTAAGSDFHLAVARGPKGEIWLAWQALREGSSDILVRRLFRGKWSPEIVVADHGANEWEPSISVAPDGTAWVGYDSYQNGNYDVFLTSVAIDKAGRVEKGRTIPVAAGEDFEAHASVEATAEGVVWVACDAAGPNWGKDYTRDTTGFRGRYGEPLHASRRILLRGVAARSQAQPRSQSQPGNEKAAGRVFEAEPAFPQKLARLHPREIKHSDTEEMPRFYELPQLVRDGEGRLWVLVRLNRQGYAGHPRQGANWEFYATCLVDGKWLEPILLPPSKGRQNQKVAAAPGKDGRLHLAWSTGDHHVDLPHRIRIGRLPPITGARTSSPAADGRRTGEHDPGRKPLEEQRPEPTSEPLVRSWKIHKDGGEYQVYFGDLHRHTDISLCTPTIDGCLVDAYRYALDAVRHDFLAVTDHTRDTDPYPWWRTQKANDLFYMPGVFAPIYAYERSNGIVGGGHRNVFFLERDWPVFRSDAHYSYTSEDRPENNNPDAALYPHLRGKAALTAAHTPGYNRKAKRGTWTYHDPQVEPIAEIIQTYRRDYVRPGSPQWPEARTRGKIAEEASLWYALAKGHRLGFIASSDHHSTHMSYACVWARSPRREDVFEALQHRRTYAATDKIILEVRLGEAIMGEEVQLNGEPELSIKARGTAPIEEVQIVRNREVVARFVEEADEPSLRLEPGERKFEMRWRDREHPGGAVYYYVRLRQQDNNMAWSSPIWVKP